MKNCIYRCYAYLAQAIVCLALGLGSWSAFAADNFLKAQHEQYFNMGKILEKDAKSVADKTSGLQIQASALNSLGQSTEALIVIDRALEMLTAPENNELIVTKAGILFSLNSPQDSLKLLAPQRENSRQLAAGKTLGERSAALGSYTQVFVTSTFDYMQLEQWQDAIKTLADAESPSEGAQFYAYRSLVYRYIMARAQDPSLANLTLEQQALYYTTHDKGHYGALLRMWQGADTTKEIAKMLAAMPAVEQQDAFAEVLFYGGAYAKFVKGDAAKGKGQLELLNRVAPYGSIEWMYGKHVL